MFFVLSDWEKREEIFGQNGTRSCDRYSQNVLIGKVVSALDEIFPNN